MGTHRPTASAHGAQIGIRAMRRADLPALVALDASVFGEPRSAYFEERLAALGTADQPSRTIGLVAEDADVPGTLVGLVMGTLTQGEFGFAQGTVLIDAIAVHPSAQRTHVGRALTSAFLEASAAQGAHEVYTLVNWNAWDLLRFFEALGFSLAATIPLRRTVS